MADNNFEQNEYFVQENQQNIPNQVEEKASVGLAILSFFIPLAGLIIFLVEKDKRPKTAMVSGICALVSFIISLASTLIMTLAGGAIFASLDDEDLDIDDSYYEEILTDENGELDWDLTDEELQAE